MERRNGYGCVAVLFSGARVLALWCPTLEEAQRGLDFLRASTPDAFFVLEECEEPMSLLQLRCQRMSMIASV